jgi:hypothetical protein
MGRLMEAVGTSAHYHRLAHRSQAIRLTIANLLHGATRADEKPGEAE